MTANVFLLVLCGSSIAADVPSVVEPFKDGDRICFVGDSITRGGWFLAEGVNLAGNLKTPQYQQSLKITKANQRWHDIESVAPRGVALVHGALRKAKIDPNDKTAAAMFLNEFIAAHQDEKGNFGKTMYARYLSTWGRDEQKNLALIESLIVTIRETAAPRFQQMIVLLRLIVHSIWFAP
ncbi:MAG: hypothetical protein SGI77_19685 [Pirellulaceae bacterium]|nr:hypothetical protein [Pirellulaceae bacterium]